MKANCWGCTLKCYNVNDPRISHASQLMHCMDNLGELKPTSNLNGNLQIGWNMNINLTCKMFGIFSMIDITGALKASSRGRHPVNWQFI